jgi:hypothetical protein
MFAETAWVLALAEVPALAPTRDTQGDPTPTRPGPPILIERRFRTRPDCRFELAD